jgi:hypothetical protein
MSYTMSAAWSHLVSSVCCTEHGQRLSAVLSDRITTITMSRSGQLGRYCTIEPNHSDLSACFAGASITHERALKTCEPSCVPEAVRHFFIPVTARWGPWGTWQHWSCPLGEAELGVMRHVAAPEPTLAGRRGPKMRNTWHRRSSTQQVGKTRGHETCGSTGAHLSREVRSGAT